MKTAGTVTRKMDHFIELSTKNQIRVRAVIQYCQNRDFPLHGGAKPGPGTGEIVVRYHKLEILCRALIFVIIDALEIAHQQVQVGIAIQIVKKRIGIIGKFPVQEIQLFQYEIGLLGSSHIAIIVHDTVIGTDEEIQITIGIQIAQGQNGCQVAVIEIPKLAPFFEQRIRRITDIFYVCGRIVVPAIKQVQIAVGIQVTKVKCGFVMIRGIIKLGQIISGLQAEFGLLRCPFVLVVT